MKLPHHGRSDYIPAPKRKTNEWPGNKRLAFCINNNIVKRDRAEFKENEPCSQVKDWSAR